MDSTVFAQISALLQILLIDIVMSGDNALAVGIAASGLPADQRHRAVMAGVVVATVLRILLAFFAVRILHITGLLLAGGLILAWVAWKLYHEIRHMQATHKLDPEPSGEIHKPVVKTFAKAMFQIIVADVSMSVDNVLAVAGTARDHVGVLVFGLVVSVLLMGVASAFVARLTARHTWIGYLGVAIMLYTALHMMWDGGWDLWGRVG